MIKISKIVLTLCVLILCMVLSGCGNNGKIKTGLFMSKAERLKTSLVPVYKYSHSNPNRLHLTGFHFDYAVKNPSGQFEQFDNDGDYEEYAELVDIVTLLCADTQIYWLDHPDDLFQDGWDYLFRTDPESYNEQFLRAYKDHISLIEGVAEYLYGDKSKIDNEKLFSSIEKIYINYKPDNWNYEFSEYYSDGRIKRYMANVNREDMPNLHCGIDASAAKSDTYYLADYTPVPKGSLILSFCGK